MTLWEAEQPQSCERLIEIMADEMFKMIPPSWINYAVDLGNAVTGDKGFEIPTAHFAGTAELEDTYKLQALVSYLQLPPDFATSLLTYLSIYFRGILGHARRLRGAAPRRQLGARRR